MRVLLLGEVEAVQAGDLLALLESRGEPIGIEDVLIGATASMALQPHVARRRLLASSAVGSEAP